MEHTNQPAHHCPQKEILHPKCASEDSDQTAHQTLHGAHISEGTFSDISRVERKTGVSQMVGFPQT